MSSLDNPNGIGGLGNRNNGLDNTDPALRGFAEVKSLDASRDESRRRELERKAERAAAKEERRKEKSGEKAQEEVKAAAQKREDEKKAIIAAAVAETKKAIEQEKKAMADARQAKEAAPIDIPKAREDPPPPVRDVWVPPEEVADKPEATHPFRVIKRNFDGIWKLAVVDESMLFDSPDYTDSLSITGLVEVDTNWYDWTTGDDKVWLEIGFTSWPAFDSATIKTDGNGDSFTGGEVTASGAPPVQEKARVVLATIADDGGNPAITQLIFDHLQLVRVNAEVASGDVIPARYPVAKASGDTAYPWLEAYGKAAGGHSVTFGSVTASFTSTAPELISGLAFKVVGDTGSTMTLVVGDDYGANDKLKFENGDIKAELTWFADATLTLEGAGGNSLVSTVNSGAPSVTAKILTEYVTVLYDSIKKQSDLDGESFAVFVDAPATGDIIYYDGDKWARLAAGSEGDILRMGADLFPYWDTPETCA